MISYVITAYENKRIAALLYMWWKNTLALAQIIYFSKKVKNQ